MASTSKAAARGVGVLGLAVAALATAAHPSRAVLSIEEARPCSDAYALKNIAFDGRMTAVMMYYKGYAESIADRDRQDCLRRNVVQDGRYAVIGQTMVLIDSECLPVEAAARKALEGLCP